MDSLSAISPSEWVARKTHFAELTEKMSAFRLTDVEKSEKRSLQRRLAGHQGRQDAKVSKSMICGVELPKEGRPEQGRSAGKTLPRYVGMNCSRIDQEV